MPDLSDLLFVGAQSVLSALVRACWQGSLAILCAWLLCRLFHRLSARWHCWIWRLAYLKLFAALLVAAPVVLPILPPQAAPQAALRSLSVPPERWNADPQATRTHLQPPARPVLPAIALSLWTLGAAWNFGRVVRQGRKFAMMRARSRPVTDAAICAECSLLCAEMKLSRSPQMLLCEHCLPMVHGIAAPALLFPEPLITSLTPIQRRMILAHEIAHLKRGDLVWMWLPGLARCLFYFLPSVWLAEREWQQSQEMACDEHALRQTAVSRSEYGAMLLRLVVTPRTAIPTAMAAIAAADSFASVRRRLLAMKHLTNRPSRSIAAIALLTAVGLGGIVPWRVVAQDTAANDKRKLDAASSGVTPFSKKLYAALGLTEKQEQQMQAIRDDTARRVGQVLTAEQRKRLLEAADPKRAASVDLFAGLGLNEAQSRRIKLADEQADKRLQALKQDQSLSGVQREAQIKEVNRLRNAEILATLTAEQRERLDAVKRAADADKNGLDLTDEQKHRAEQIKRGVGEQMERLQQDHSLSKEQIKVQAELIQRAAEEELRQMLTPEQRDNFEKRQRMERAASVDGPLGLLAVMRLEGLTAAQRTSLKKVYEDAEEQIQQVLTTEQKARLKEIRGAASSRESDRHLGGPRGDVRNP